MSTKDALRRLGAGEPIEAVCRAAGWTRREFDQWWQETIRSRVPPASGRRQAAVANNVRIQPDRWGIPHIFAENDRDLFFAFGYATAQDRLFQLDYLRRKGLGRLAEILGNEGVESDLIARTVGLNRIAAAEWQRLSGEVQDVLQAYTAGINAVIEDCGDNLPIEFDLLDYRPEPWSPIDCLAIEVEFRWYLTGRFPIIFMPELAKRALGEGTLYQEFLLGEAEDESILQPGEYTPASRGGPANRVEPVGSAMNDPEGAIGSNNWVVAGKRTTTGLPLLASDPHIAFGAVSCWYEAHLCGGSFNVAGMTYVGMPAILVGRNERVAWGITNNICSQRDLYQEKVAPERGDCFLYDGRPEPARELVETIRIKGREPISKTIRFSRNGPVVDELLPAAATAAGPVTLKWLGAYQGGWLTALLAMDRAGSAEEFRAALRPWHVPTFSLVIADVAGNIAYQASGRVPVRKTYERGYRPGRDPEHQWQGLIPFEEMPHVVNPPRGWVATANNRVAPEDFPYSLFGCWSSGGRAVRIRQMIESRDKTSPGDMCQMHMDAVSPRAKEVVPALLSALSSCDDARVREAAAHLKAWDFCCEPDSVATTIFNVFFTQWCKAVASARFDPQLLEVMQKGVEGCASRLLVSDASGWFAAGERERRVVDAFRATLDLLSQRFGGDIASWKWEHLHRMPLKHPLSARGDLAQLLDRGGQGVRGDMTTVCNTGCGPDWDAATGAGYRMVVDLSQAPPRLLAIDAGSQSGHPGSPHYDDQYPQWLAGNYHEIRLSSPEANDSESDLTLEPKTPA
jgi:penicillin amidase